MEDKEKKKDEKEEVQKVRKTERENVVFVLTDEEKIERGETQAKSHERKEDLLNEIAIRKSKIKKIDAELSTLHQAILFGQELRYDVEVETIHDYEEKEVVYIHPRTGKTLRKRVMMKSELQQELPLDDGVSHATISMTDKEREEFSRGSGDILLDDDGNEITDPDFDMEETPLEEGTVEDLSRVDPDSVDSVVIPDED